MKMALNSLVAQCPRLSKTSSNRNNDASSKGGEGGVEADGGGGGGVGFGYIVQLFFSEIQN